MVAPWHELPFSPTEIIARAVETELREVLLGYIQVLGKGILATFDCGERKCRHIGLPGHPNHGRKNDDFDSFRFFNRCNCRETEKRN